MLVAQGWLKDPWKRMFPDPREEGSRSKAHTNDHGAEVYYTR